MAKKTKKADKPPRTAANSTGIVKTLILMKKHWQIYLLLAAPLLWYILFAYYPLAGLQLAFKTYKAKLGIWESPWADPLWKNYTALFKDAFFWRSVRRTLLINFGRLIIVFPFPIILALALNELRLKKSKKFMQTVFTFPHFLSWVIVVAIMRNLLSVDGLINVMLKTHGADPINFLGSEPLFQPMLYITDIWKSAGYSSIIYLSAISGIDQDQYEAADVDGATRWQKLTRITLPNIMPTVSIMFILATGNLMTNGFDQIFNLSNAATKNVAEVLDMYIYRITFQASADFGFSTAVSLFRSVINMILLATANKLSKMLGGSGLLG